MKFYLPAVLLPLILFSCHKDDINNGSGNNPPSSSITYVKPVKDVVKLSSISVSINGNPMKVTSISYNRSSSTFNLSAQNSLQKVDAYCFHMYGSSGLNYQYQDSLNYSVRNDSLSAWYTTRASNWGSVYFDCCSYPPVDSVVVGDFSGLFALEGKDDLTVAGNFHLVFK